MGEQSRYIFCKKYADEELSDIERDISECFDPRFNKDVEGIPSEDGFRTGQFVVTVEWRSPDWCSCTGFNHSSSCRHWVLPF